MAELVTLGETMAVFAPTANEPLRYATHYRIRIAGAESNLAIGLQKLGHSAGWISRLGEDEFGHFILNQIRAEGVDTSRVVFDGQHRSGVMFKEINAISETKVFYYREGSAASFLSPADIDPDYIAAAKILHITGITPVLSESCSLAVQKAIAIARQNQVLISFDPNIRLKLWNGRDYTPLMLEILKQADIISLGVGEARILLQTDAIHEIFEQLFKLDRLTYLAVKDGPNGAWVGTKDAIHQIPPTKWKRIDAVGAGDAFNAGFLAGILEGLPLETCGTMGSIMGGLATQTAGDTEGLPSQAEMHNFLTNKEIIYR